jgi:hypothetical protein
MKLRTSTHLILALAGVLLVGATGCGQEVTSGGSGGAGSNVARFTFDCDLQGLTGALTMDIEAINSAGAVFGSGPNPAITGVIAAGGVLYVTAGELRSATASYVFTGDNQFADFTDIATSQRVRVQFLPSNQGVTLVIDPFGPAPTQNSCVETGARYL